MDPPQDQDQEQQQQQQPYPKKLKMSSTNSDSDTPPKPYRPKRRKLAIFLAYLGLGYKGMQRNPGAKTIESDLEHALVLAGAVPERDRNNPRTYDFARSARTDKGVSAVGQVVSGRFYLADVNRPENDLGLVERLNEHLPEGIRVFGYRRATGSFSAKKFCDRRRYMYLIPVFALDPTCHRDRESVRESGGSGGELVKCLACSERGRKVFGVMGKRSFGNVVVGGDESVKNVDLVNGDCVLSNGVMGKRGFGNVVGDSVNIVDLVNGDCVLSCGENVDGDGVVVEDSKGCSGNGDCVLSCGENVDGDGVVVEDSKGCSGNGGCVLSCEGNVNGDGVAVSDSKGSYGNGAGSGGVGERSFETRVGDSVKNVDLVNGDGDFVLSSGENVNGGGVGVEDCKGCHGNDVLSSGKNVNGDCVVESEVKEVVVSGSKDCPGNDECVLNGFGEMGERSFVPKVGGDGDDAVKNVDSGNGDGESVLNSGENVNGDGVAVSESKGFSGNGDCFLSCAKDVNVDGTVDAEVKEVVVLDSESTKQPEVAREIGDSQSLNPEPESLASSVAEVEGREQSRFSYGNEERERFNRILKSYVGSHNFHNFTTRTKAEDPAAMRYIISFDASTTVTVDGIEFVKCEVVGQSFMLHQIRKMIGLAVAIMRNCAPESLIATALQKDVHINVPTAPEVGLYLEECMFSSYNDKWKDTHEELSMKDFAEEAEEFKMKHIYTHIAATERKEGVVGLWLHSLNLRNYADLGYKTSDAEKIAGNGKIEGEEKSDE